MGRTDPVLVAEVFLTMPARAGDVSKVLTSIATELDTLNKRQAALWRARRIAYGAGRVADPPITLVELAAMAGVSQPQVSRALDRPVPKPL